MKYRITVTATARDALDAQFAYLSAQGVGEAVLARWRARLQEQFQSLRELPRRFPVSEVVSAARGEEVRRMNFGQYAIFFCIREDKAAVELVAFRHGRRRPE